MLKRNKKIIWLFAGLVLFSLVANCHLYCGTEHLDPCVYGHFHCHDGECGIEIHESSHVDDFQKKDEFHLDRFTIVEEENVLRDSESEREFPFIIPDGAPQEKYYITHRVLII